MIMRCKFINVSIYTITENHSVAVSQTKNDHISQQTFVGLEDALKTSSTRPQRNNFTSSKMSWRRLKDVLEDEKLLRWRCLEDVFKTCLEDVLKMSWRHILNTSWRHYGDKQNTYWGSVSNKSDYVSNKSIFQKFISDNSKANPKCIN